MNRVELVGRLVAKPILRYTKANIPVTKFTVAIDRFQTDCEKRTDFIPINTWRTQAETVCKYLDKGSLVSVTGSLQTNNYTDKDGNKKSFTEVLAEKVEFLSPKKSDNEETTRIGTPADYEQNQDDDPFADFGENVKVDDNFLE